jgi:serine/threonine protein kinase/tetratricopeptide (TPR) repeat protein
MREREIFIAALQREDPQDRRAYQEQACGPDAGLWDRVQALLGAFDRAGSFLHEPAVDLGATGAFMPSRENGTQAMDSSPLEGPGTVIGPYKLLEQIGEGGMGVVYMAEQTKPVRRKVALKIVKPGMDTRQVIARFEAERQALALMDHPSIARVLDAGATESGRPYFVMELVKGIPITEYCDRNRLAIADRLELFVKVCQAVQHAHQKGIIHRDLKPTNVLVTMIDGAAVPKVIDFGVAKAVGQQLTEKTLFTGFAQLIGTPLYMSPEQAEFSGVDVDTRSDIYSLGVLLYQLLTGTTPFDADTFRTAAYDEIRRIIREEEPPKPSTRISTLEATATAVSANRQTDPRTLGKLMRGELDWIVMAALEKDRNRRYETASAFAADVRRYLDDEPVQACPPSAWYRFRKLARRNRVALVTSAVVATALVLGTGVSTWQAIRAARAERAAREQRDAATAARDAEVRARKRAENAESSARAEADKATAINDFLTKDLLTQAHQGNSTGAHKVTLIEVVDRAADKVGERFHDQPEAESALRMTLVDTYHSLNAFAKAKSQAQAALEIERRHHGPEAAGTFRALSEVAHLRTHLEPSSKVLELLQEAIEGLQRTLGPDHPHTLEGRNNLALAYNGAGRTTEATKLLEENLKIRTAKLGPGHDSTLISQQNLAFVYASAGRTAEAIRLGEENLKLIIAKVGPEDISTLNPRRNLGEAYRKAGRTAEAIRLAEENLKLGTAMLGPDDTSTLVSRNNLALAYNEAGRRAEAIRLGEETLKLMIAKLGPDGDYTLASRNNLGLAYKSAGRTAEATKLLEENFKLVIAKLGPDAPHTLESHSNLASAFESLGNWAEAESLRRDVLARSRKTTPPDSPDLARRLDALGMNLLTQAKWSEAESVLRECLAIRAKAIPGDWPRFNTMSVLGGALLGQAKYAEAQPLLVQGYEGLKACEAKIPQFVKVCLVEAGERVVALYKAWGKPNQATAWRAKLPPASAELPADVFALP